MVDAGVQINNVIPSLGFSKDLAKRLNPRKSFLSRKGRDNRHWPLR
jgi:hypothetical protein